MIRLRSLLSVCATTLLCACGSGDQTASTTETRSASAPEISAPPPDSSAAGTARSPAERLGLDETRAGIESIDAVFSGAGYSLIGSIISPFKKLPLGERGDVVRGLALCLQAYYQSGAFKTDYAKIRAERKPQPTVYEQTPQQELEAGLAHDRKEIDEARTSVLPMLPAESRAEVEENYKQTEKMLADPEMQKYRLMGIEGDRAQRQADYENSVQKWQTTYPEDPRPIIVNRLKEFVALTDDIDFDAKLVDAAGGQKKFANPEYENKPWDWKWAYRAGEESVNAAREVAKTWLDELE